VGGGYTALGLVFQWCKDQGRPDPADFYALPGWLQDHWLAFYRLDLSGRFRGAPPAHRPPLAPSKQGARTRTRKR